MEIVCHDHRNNLTSTFLVAGTSLPQEKLNPHFCEYVLQTDPPETILNKTLKAILHHQNNLTQNNLEREINNLTLIHDVRMGDFRTLLYRENDLNGKVLITIGPWE